MTTEERLRRYQALLLKWQQKINLISPATIDTAWERHFEDSMQLADFLPHHAQTLIDLGSGAGFPGLVLAMMRPEVAVHLIEADHKKSSFLKAVSRDTNVPVQVYTERIEAVRIEAVPDVITARALAPLQQLFDYSAQWIARNPDLVLILPKGEKVEDEIKAAQALWAFDCDCRRSQTDARGSVLLCTRIRRLSPHVSRETCV